MRTRLSQSFSSVLVALVLVSAGCNNDKPKPEDTKKAEPTPVPSDMVFNDFIPNTGGPTGMRARDAGLEGGLADIQGGPAEQDPNGGPAAGNGTKMVEAGADPKAVRKYTFTKGKVDKRLLTVTTSGQEVVGGQPTGQPQEVTMKMSLDLTVKEVKKEGATLEVKLTKLELPGLPPEAAPMAAQLAGISGTFDVTPQGDVGELGLQPTPAMQRNQLAPVVVQSLSQALALLVCPLPSEPIGAGAKWNVASAPGAQEGGSKHFSAKELSADAATIETEIEILVPRRQQQVQGGRTAVVEAQGKGKYVYQLKWNQTAPHVEGAMQIVEKAEISAGGQKQMVQRIQAMKQVIEVGK